VPRSAIRKWRKRERVATLFGEQCARQGQQLFAEAVGQQAVAANAHEAFGQYMQKKAAEEVHGVEGHDLLLAAVGIVAPEKTDALPVEGGDAVVGDGHAMGVTAEVAQNMFGSAEGRLGVNVPALFVEFLEQLLESGPVAEVRRRASAIEHASAIEVAEAGEELVAEGNAQNRHRQQEHRMAGVDPALIVRQIPPAGTTAWIW